MRLLSACLLLLTLSRCSGTDPETEAALQAAQAALDAGRLEEAAAAARTILADHPTEARARGQLGVALIRQARVERQAVDASRFEEMRGSADAEAFFDPTLYKTEVRYQHPLAEEAEAELLRALEAPRPALEVFVSLATLYAETDRFTQELDVLGRAARAHAGDADAASRLITFGERYFRAARYKQAGDVFELLAGSFEDHPALSLDRAAAQFAAGRYREGTEALARASARHPSHGNMLRTLGQMYLFQMEWEKAAETFGRLAAAEPEERMAPVHVGAALLPVDRERARSALQALPRPSGESADQASVIASHLLHASDEAKTTTEDLVGLAGQLHQHGFPQIGVAVCGEILRRDAGSVPARIMLAFVYDGMRYYDLALAQLDQASAVLARAPAAPGGITQGDLQSHYGRVRFHQGDYRKAIEAYGAAEDPARYDLPVAISYERLGDFESAYAHFRKVVSRGEPKGQVQQARGHLMQEPYARFRE